MSRSITSQLPKKRRLIASATCASALSGSSASARRRGPDPVPVHRRGDILAIGQRQQAPGVRPLRRQLGGPHQQRHRVAGAAEPALAHHDAPAVHEFVHNRVVAGGAGGAPGALPPQRGAGKRRRAGQAGCQHRPARQPGAGRVAIRLRGLAVRRRRCIGHSHLRTIRIGRRGGAGVRFGPRRSRRGWRDQAIAHARNRLDPERVAMPGQRAQLGDGAIDRGVGHDAPLPAARDQRVAADHAAPRPAQRHQHLHHPRLERPGRAVGGDDGPLHRPHQQRPQRQGALPAPAGWTRIPVGPARRLPSRARA